MEKNKTKLVLDFGLIFVISIIFIGGLLKTLIFPKQINEYENRSANKTIKPTINNFSKCEFQDSFELALADQIFLSTTMKVKYNYINNILIKNFYTYLENTEFKNKYINLDGIYKLGGSDYLLYYPYKLENIKNDILSRGLNINEIAKKFPDVDVLVYFIEKDTDINFETNQKSNSYEYLKSVLNDEKINVAKFEINSYDDYKKYFYKTDHHWKAEGSYKGYTEILRMCSNDEPIKPIEKKIIGEFAGSKSRMSGKENVYKENFEAFVFEFPEHKTYIAGVEKEYGNEEEMLNNVSDTISYGNFYGGDNGEIHFDYNNPEKENILIIGESYDNAILKLLAAHFNNTYSIDFRSYESEVGKKFSIDDYIKEKDIDKIIFVGNIDFYIIQNFNIGE